MPKETMSNRRRKPFLDIVSVPFRYRFDIAFAGLSLLLWIWICNGRVNNFNAAVSILYFTAYCSLVQFISFLAMWIVPMFTFFISPLDLEYLLLTLSRSLYLSYIVSCITKSIGTSIDTSQVKEMKININLKRFAQLRLRLGTDLLLKIKRSESFWFRVSDFSSFLTTRWPTNAVFRRQPIVSGARGTVVGSSDAQTSPPTRQMGCLKLRNTALSGNLLMGKQRQKTIECLNKLQLWCELPFSSSSCGTWFHRGWHWSFKLTFVPWSTHWVWP